MKLTPRQLRFVEAYEGNGAAAARAAGYKGTVQALSTQAARLLKKAEVRAAIDARLAPKQRAAIASREDRQRFWSRVMRSRGHELKDRLKASELLGKSQADFVERHEHSGLMSLAVVDPYAEKKP